VISLRRLRIFEYIDLKYFYLSWVPEICIIYVFEILALKLVPFTQWFLPSLVSTQLEFPGFPPVCVYLCGPPVCVRACVCARQWPRRHPSVGKECEGEGASGEQGESGSGLLPSPVASCSVQLFSYFSLFVKATQATAANGSGKPRGRLPLALAPLSLSLSLSR